MEEDVKEESKNGAVEGSSQLRTKKCPMDVVTKEAIIKREIW
jgi:hypothetical protein